MAPRLAGDATLPDCVQKRRPLGERQVNEVRLAEHSLCHLVDGLQGSCIKRLTPRLITGAHFGQTYEAQILHTSVKRISRHHGRGQGLQRLDVMFVSEQGRCWFWRSDRLRPDYACPQTLEPADQPAAGGSSRNGGCRDIATLQLKDPIAEGIDQLVGLVLHVPSGHPKEPFASLVGLGMDS